MSNSAAYCSHTLIIIHVDYTCDSDSPCDTRLLGTELRLLTDYLTNRKQYVVFNNHCSDITDIVILVWTIKLLLYSIKLQH